MIRAVAVTKILVVAKAYECKDGSFAALAVDPETEARLKSYHSDWDEARNTAQRYMAQLLGDRTYKPGYGRNKRGNWSCNCWA
jgi:hypothetical protein